MASSTRLHSSETTDTLLFIARTFFLPPESPDALPTPDIASMNHTISEDHPWVAFNRSLASLCTLHGDTANNVFGFMLLPSRQQLEVEEHDLPVEGDSGPNLHDVDKVQFLCADNWDMKNGELQLYVNGCLTRILAVSEEAEKAEREGRHPAAKSGVIDDFITHVYKNGWSKFRERIKKSGDRGHRLAVLLFNLQKGSKIPKPPGLDLPNLIRAINNVINLVNANQPQPNYVAIHGACNQLYEAAFNDALMKHWLHDLVLHGMTISGACPPIRILQKIVKLRNGIETLMVLVHEPNMRPTFRGARAARDNGELVTWVPAPAAKRHDALSVDVSKTATKIMKIYDAARQKLSVDERANCADAHQIWDRIRDGMKNVPKLREDMARDITLKSEKWKIPGGQRKQHCEGKLVSYVIDKDLLGKVFPYIGCSKRCCEPCFTAISAVNDIIVKTLAQRNLCFAVADTHRKVYPGFGISSIKNSQFKQFTEMFNVLLCRDIGMVVKAGSKKGTGESDSAPEPEPPAQ